eukprot:Sdes_comp19936_c0_seq1m12410
MLFSLLGFSGDVDELNCCLGVAREFCRLDAGKLTREKFQIDVKISRLQNTTKIYQREIFLADMLLEIQSCLFDIGSHLATPPLKSSEKKLLQTFFDPDASFLLELEIWIDFLDSQCPPLKNFIIPGGSLLSASLHHARAVCRRAERTAFELASSGSQGCSKDVGQEESENENNQSVEKYLNRLSDFLFSAARFVNFSSNSNEIVYQKNP